MAVELARRFPGISPKTYEHPADRAATAAIRAIPVMEPLLKRLSELGLERQTREILLANSIRLGPDQVPAVWEQHVVVASTLDLEPPPLYVTQTPFVNALTAGAHRPVVVLSSAVVTGHDPDDIRCVLAHETGHVLSRHGYYSSVLFILSQVLNSVVPVPLLAGLPVRALYLALLEWSRAAELSSDRAAAICLGDPLAVCATLMRVAGGDLPGANLQAFLRQATEYVEEEDLFALRARLGTELVQTHPYAVRRVKELVDWVGRGEYDRIVSGTYLRRGEEAPVSAEVDAAFHHYNERFWLMLQRAGGGLGKLTDQIQAWLGRHPAGGEHDAEVVDGGLGTDEASGPPG